MNQEGIDRGLAVLLLLLICGCVSERVFNETVLGTPIPQAVWRHAHAEARSRYSRRTDQTDYANGFICGFQEGLMYASYVQMPSCEIQPALIDGINHGRMASTTERRSANSLSGVTLADYGYTHIVTNGAVRFQSGVNSFQPDSSDEQWWVVDGCQFCAMYESAIEDIPAACRTNLLVTARVLGYLSPPARTLGYGHMCLFSREFVINEVHDLRVGSTR